jgi:phage repressor protein C with HTH and peptisase S24 domain
MLPTYAPGDWLVVRWGARVRVGDVVVATRGDGTLVIKRVAREHGSQWWLEGDNPAETTDSRSIGPFNSGQIKGRVLFRYRRGDRAGS